MGLINVLKQRATVLGQPSVSAFSISQASPGSQALSTSGLSAICCVCPSPRTATFRIIRLWPYSPASQSYLASCPFLLEARQPSQKPSSGLPQPSNGQSCHGTTPKPIAGTGNPPQASGETSRDSPPGGAHEEEEGGDLNRIGVLLRTRRTTHMWRRVDHTHNYSRRLFSNPAI